MTERGITLEACRVLAEWEHKAQAVSQFYGTTSPASFEAWSSLARCLRFVTVAGRVWADGDMLMGEMGSHGLTFGVVCRQRPNPDLGFAPPTVTWDVNS